MYHIFTICSAVSGHLECFLQIYRTLHPKNTRSSKQPMELSQKIDQPVSTNTRELKSHPNSPWNKAECQQ